jgi:GNAT superfamily N-acetyltransferase
VKLDHSAVLAEFDAQVRRRMEPDGPGRLAERAGPVLRWTDAESGWCGIEWSDLDSATADEAITDQVRFFRARGERFEWKLYNYDQPADLGQRLRAAGFVPEDEEALMVAEVAELVNGEPVPADVPLPAGVRLLPVTSEAGIGQLIEVHDRVFGIDHWQLRSSLTAQLASSPEATAMVVAMAGDEPVCAGRIDFYAGTEFAGLYGGGTLPQWRGRGIYRALVAYRARLAAARGCRYLQVDASPESRPILERLGFDCLALTTPYIWSPG